MLQFTSARQWLLTNDPEFSIVIQPSWTTLNVRTTLQEKDPKGHFIELNWTRWAGEKPKSLHPINVTKPYVSAFDWFIATTSNDCVLFGRPGHALGKSYHADPNWEHPPATFWKDTCTLILSLWSFHRHAIPLVHIRKKGLQHNGHHSKNGLARVMPGRIWSIHRS